MFELKMFKLKKLFIAPLSRFLVVISTLIAQAMTAVVPAETASTLSGQELGCLAMNIYQEGRSEPTQGKLAIAAVTMNRVASRHYPNTVCEVVWQPKQFSWTNLKTKYHTIKDAKAWVKAIEIADLFMHGADWNGVGDAKHYHTTAVQPNWSDNERVVAQIGNHLFYQL